MLLSQCIILFYNVPNSVAELEPPRNGIFRAASFRRKAKSKSLFLLSMNSVQFITEIKTPKRILKLKYFRAQNGKF